MPGVRPGCKKELWVVLFKGLAGWGKCWGFKSILPSSHSPPPLTRSACFKPSGLKGIRGLGPNQLIID